MERFGKEIILHNLNFRVQVLFKKTSIEEDDENSRSSVELDTVYWEVGRPNGEADRRMYDH